MTHPKTIKTHTRNVFVLFQKVNKHIVSIQMNIKLIIFLKDLQDSLLTQDIA